MENLEEKDRVRKCKAYIIHGSTFVDQQSAATAVHQQMLSSASCLALLNVQIQSNLF